MRAELKVALVLIISLIFWHTICADVVYLKNGDKISGEVIEQNDDTISLKTESMGTIFIRKDSLDRIESEKEPSLKKEKLWDREISLGYNKSSGNTESSQLLVRFHADRKSGENEFNFKVDMLYSSTDKEMDAQKWYGLVRYASKLRDKRWYYFYKLEADHDRFANINFRVIPSYGMGYWFSDTENWKAMIDCGMGFEHTDFRSDIGDSNEVNLVPRIFLEKKLFNDSKISQYFTLYNSLEDVGDFRLHSETALTNPITNNLSIRFSLIDDYDSDPAENIEKNDMRFTSSLIYTF